MATENIIVKQLLDTESNLETNLTNGGEIGLAIDTNAVIYKLADGTIKTIRAFSGVTLTDGDVLPTGSSINDGDVFVLQANALIVLIVPSASL